MVETRFKESTLKTQLLIERRSALLMAIRQTIGAKCYKVKHRFRFFLHLQLRRSSSSSSFTDSRPLARQIQGTICVELAESSESSFAPVTTGSAFPRDRGNRADFLPLFRSFVTIQSSRCSFFGGDRRVNEDSPVCNNFIINWRCVKESTFFNFYINGILYD